MKESHNTIRRESDSFITQKKSQENDFFITRYVPLISVKLQFLCTICHINRHIL
jgi:hypothetical protein